MIEDQAACRLSHNPSASVIDLFHNAAVFLIYKDSFGICQVIGSLSGGAKLASVLISKVDSPCLFSCLGIIKDQILILISQDRQGIAADICHTI